MSADFIAAFVLVFVNRDSLTTPEALLLAAGGAALATASAAILLFVTNLAVAPYRQRNHARRRLIASIAVDALLLEPLPDGLPAYLKVTNQGPSGTFRVRLLMDSGQEIYLGWEEDMKRDKHLFTGETGLAFVARVEHDPEYMNGYAMIFYEADGEEPRSAWSTKPGAETTMRATVLSDHGRPAHIDMVLGMTTRGESWDGKYQMPEIVLHRGLFKPMDDAH